MLLPLLVEARSDRAMRFAFCRNIISVDVIYNDASKVEVFWLLGGIRTRVRTSTKRYLNNYLFQSLTL